MNMYFSRHIYTEITRKILHLLSTSIGGDVVEVAPPFDPSGNTAFVGASLMFDIMCLVADSASTRVNRKK